VTRDWTLGRRSTVSHVSVHSNARHGDRQIYIAQPNTGSSEPNYMSENTEIECSDTHRCDIRRLLATAPHPPYPPPHRSKVYISGDTPSSASLTAYITVRTILNV
jgi:hypothetical protein